MTRRGGGEGGGGLGAEGESWVMRESDRVCSSEGLRGCFGEESKAWSTDTERRGSDAGCLFCLCCISLKV